MRPTKGKQTKETTVTKSQETLQAALEAQGFEVLQGKGGFWLRGHGHVTTAVAPQANRYPADLHAEVQGRRDPAAAR
jgi:hypothetical protein